MSNLSTTSLNHADFIALQCDGISLWQLENAAWNNNHREIGNIQVLTHQLRSLSTFDHHSGKITVVTSPFDIT